MSDISKAERAKSKIERMITNGATAILANSKFAYLVPYVQPGINAVYESWGTEIDGFLAKVFQSEASMDAGKQIAKEKFGSFLDDFEKELKTKTEENNAQNTVEK